MLQLQPIREIFSQLLYDVKFPSFKVWTLSIDAIWAFAARYEYYLSKLIHNFFIITARVRSTREGNIYTWECLSVHHCRGDTLSQVWGGVPHLRSGGRGVPDPRYGGGYPIPGLAMGGYPIPGLAGGYPISGLGEGGT